jgi:ubiquinone/menaquinone biosynthesis C-methylase UbiE
MKQLDQFIASQLGNPHGAFDRLVTSRILQAGNQSLNDWTLGLLDLHADDVVLDLGCGPGAAVRALAQTSHARLPAGLDYAAAMTGEAHRRNAAGIQAGRVGIVRGDAAQLPYRDQIFTCVYSVNVLYFWSDPLRALLEVRRVLQPGGVVAVAVRPKERIEHLGFTRHGLRLYDADDLLRLLGAAGFTRTQWFMQPAMRGLGGLCDLGRR